jgi:hypothetical protein
MARNVMEDIRFGQVIQMIGLANGDGGGKFAIAEAIEKQECRNVACDCSCSEAGERRQEPVHVV